MMFTISGVPHRIVEGLDGGVYLCRWRGGVWQIVGSEDIE